MALTPPFVEDFEAFSREDYPDVDHPWVESMLQQATDALWVTTGLEDRPTDPRAARILDYAIFDLTLWLMSQVEHRDEINSPFSGERIGSYSYTKLQQAQRGEETGLYWLDMFFRLLRSPGEQAESAWVSSERVFNPDGRTLAEAEAYEKATLHDPSEPWGFN